MATTAWAASAKATALRQANGLTAFTPPEKFLAGNFVADEMNPGFIFGAVKAFAASRKCPTTWLIEEGDKNRPAGPGTPDTPAEYTLYLEEDCPDQVVYYVFIDQSGLTPQQWIEWREKFHKSKTGEQFGTAKSKLEQPAPRVAGSAPNCVSSRRTGNSWPNLRKKFCGKISNLPRSMI